MRLRTQCHGCGLPFTVRLDRQGRDIECPNCGVEQPVDLAGWSETDPRAITTCLLCGCRHLYRQRDVNRALGCLLVAVGAALVPWTYGLSLVILAGVDLILYYRLPEAVVCYRCDTVYRDARPGPRQNAFDLLKHDVLKYGKSWQELADDTLEAGSDGPTSASAAPQRMALDDAVEDRGQRVKRGD